MNKGGMEEWMGGGIGRMEGGIGEKEKETALLEWSAWSQRGSMRVKAPPRMYPIQVHSGHVTKVTLKSYFWTQNQE